MKQVDIDIAGAVIRAAVVENHIDELKRLSDDVSPVSFSEAHEKRMKRLFARVRAKRAAVRVWSITWKTAVVVAFVIAVISSVLLSNPKVYAAVSEVVIEFFSQFTTLRFSNSEETVKITEWELSWLPESFSETYREYDEGSSRAGYSDSNGIIIRFTASPSDSSQINVDNEQSAYSIKTTAGIDYYIFASTSEEAPSIIVWGNEGYSFMISSLCDIEILEKIAYSIKMVDE